MAGLETCAALFLGVAGLVGAACGGNVVVDASSGTSHGSSGSGGEGASGVGGVSGAGGVGASGTSGPTGTGGMGIACSTPSGPCVSDPCTPFPAGGTPCTNEGVTCSYTSQGGDLYNFAVCYHGTWYDRACPGLFCGCPTTLPAAGSTCDPCWEEPCSFGGDAGAGPKAQCAPDGTWTVTGG